MKFGPKQHRFVVPAPKRQENTMKIGEHFYSQVKCVLQNLSENQVQEERHMAVEAAIVRVMKSRRTLTLNEIIEQVCQILRQFSPDVKVFCFILLQFIHVSSLLKPKSSIFLKKSI